MQQLDTFRTFNFAEIYRPQLKALASLKVGEYFFDIPALKALQIIRDLEINNPSSKIYDLVALLQLDFAEELEQLTWSDFINICKIKSDSDYTLLASMSLNAQCEVGAIRMLDIYDALIESNPKSELARVIFNIITTVPGHNLYTFSALTEKEVEAIGGIGPAGMRVLKNVLSVMGLAFTTEQARQESKLNFISLIPLRRYLIYNGINSLQILSNMSIANFDSMINFYVHSISSFSSDNEDNLTRSKRKVVNNIKRALIEANIFDSKLFGES